MSYNREIYDDPDFELNEESQELPEHKLKRTWSMGKRYKNHDVKYLMKECQHLKHENTVYRTFIKNFLSRHGIKVKIIGENVVIGDENTIVNAQESVDKMESMIRGIMTTLMKQELELEQVKNMLVVVQKDLQFLNESKQNLVDGLNRLKEYLDAEIHPEHRSKKFATGMTELRSWSLSLSEKQLYNVSFDQIPNKSKPLVYHVLTKYGNYKEVLPAYFDVAGDLGMNDSKEDFITRVLTIWLYHGRREVKQLDRVFVELKKYALDVKEQNRASSEDDFGDMTSDLSGSTGTIISKGHHAEIFNLLYRIIGKQDETLKLISRQAGIEQNTLPIQEEFV